MKKILAMLLMFGVFFMVGENFASAQGKILVAYFSRTGEEYGVGNITKGNTAILAEIIAKQTGGDLFEIKTVQSYPTSYDECTKIASREKAAKARPELSTKISNLNDYDTIFIGYPIWYGDAPMAIYTFLEGYDFSGKNIIPFCTHGGSGLSSTDQSITLTCPKSKILQGFEMRGKAVRNDSAQAEKNVSEWLGKIGMK